MESFANTPQGKRQALRLVRCRLELGCLSAKDFYNQYGKGRNLDGKDLFSYNQYQKYESGERILGRKAAILFAEIFQKDWEWLQNGNESDEFAFLSDEEKDLVRNYRKSQTANGIKEKAVKAG